MSNKKYHQFDAGVPAGTDIVLYGDPSTGALKKSPVNTAGVLKVVKITKTFADFSASAQTFTIDAGFTLPAGGSIIMAQFNPSTPMAGPGMVDMSIGIGTATSEIYWTYAQVHAGIGPTLGYSSKGLNSMNSGTAVKLTAYVSGVGFTLDELTAGEVDIWIFYTVLA